jgi:hypothetical protein
LIESYDYIVYKYLILKRCSRYGFLDGIKPYLHTSGGGVLTDRSYVLSFILSRSGTTFS